MVCTTATPFLKLVTMPRTNKTPENPSNFAPKRIKEIIDTYYPQIKERLANGKKNGK